jgi:16S rRNA processing protein RimM
MTDNPERFQSKEPLWIKIDEGWKEIIIERMNLISGRPVIKIKGINSADDAKDLANDFLYIQSAALKNPPEGVFYHFDLIDCLIFDVRGGLLGRAVDVETYPANDVLVVENDIGKRFFLPMVRQFLKEINIEGKEIVVDPPEGIFD